MTWMAFVVSLIDVEIGSSNSPNAAIVTSRLLIVFPSSKVVAKGNLRIEGQSVVGKPATAAAVAV